MVAHAVRAHAPQKDRAIEGSGQLVDCWRQRAAVRAPRCVEEDERPTVRAQDAIEVVGMQHDCSSGCGGGGVSERQE